MNISYRVVDTDGNVFSKRIKMDSISELKEAVDSEGTYLLDYKIEDKRIGKKLRKIDIIDFFKGLSILLKAGIDLNTSLWLMKDSMNESFESIIDEIVEELENGNFLSQAIEKQEKIYSNLSYFFIKIGENSGRLSQNMEYLSEILEYKRDISSKIKSTLTYPLIVLFATIFLFLFMAMYLIPSFLKVFDYGDQIPVLTKILYSIGLFLRANYRLLLIVSSGLILSFSYKLRDETFKRVCKNKVLSLPFIKFVYEDFIYSFYLKALGIMLESGENLLNSLEIASSIFEATYAVEKFKNVEKHIVNGSSFSLSLDMEDLFPRQVIGIIKVGEESGRLEMVLKNISDIYRKRGEDRLERYSKLLEPALLIIITVFIGLLSVSLLLPMFKIIDLI